jgi:hypothetical protein
MINVEIGTVAAQFLSREYLFQIFGIDSSQCKEEICIGVQMVFSFSCSNSTASLLSAYYMVQTKHLCCGQIDLAEWLQHLSANAVLQ